MNILTLQGLNRFLTKLKNLIPTKTSQLQNDSGFVTSIIGNSTYATINELNSHVNNSNIHITEAQKNVWNSKANSTHQHEITDVNLLQEQLNAIRSSSGIEPLSDEELNEIVGDE